MAIEGLLRGDHLPSEEIVVDSDEILFASYDDEFSVGGDAEVSALLVGDSELVSHAFKLVLATLSVDSHDFELRCGR